MLRPEIFELGTQIADLTVVVEQTGLFRTGAPIAEQFHFWSSKIRCEFACAVGQVSSRERRQFNTGGGCGIHSYNEKWLTEMNLIGACSANHRSRPVAKVQEWLGHANIATTWIYDRRRSRPEDSPTFRSATRMSYRSRPRAERRYAKLFATGMLCLASSFTISCGNHHSGTINPPSAAKSDDEKVLNFFTWSDYIAPDTIASFEKLTGIKVNVAYFNTNEMLESQMLTGHSGFDVVVTAGPYFQRQIRSGAYLPLDKKQLPNLVNEDPALMAQAALNDPGNVYGVIYTWGTYGIGYNEQKAAQVLPNTPLRSWGLIFDPAFAAKLAPCGINIVDTPAGVTRAALKYLGRNPNEPTAQDLTDVDTPTAIRRQRLCSTSGPRRILPSFLPLISGRS